MHAPEPHGAGAEHVATISALVADPVADGIAPGWQVGQSVRPRTMDPAAARVARLEARLAVYAQYAAVVAEEAAAVVAGDDARRAALASERGATAEHFAELRQAADEQDGGASAFTDALTDALYERRHQDAIDAVLERRLRALHDAASAGRELILVHPPGPPITRQLDLRF